MKHSLQNNGKLFLAAVLALAVVCAFAWPVSAAGGSAEYVIKAGDTLSSIAARFGLTLEKLMDANPAIQDPGRITAGQVITLPAGRSEGILPARPKRMYRWEVEMNGGRVQKSDHLYLVRGGDNYLRVARRYGISVDSFFAANPQLLYLSSLRKGELVHIPVNALGEGIYTFYVTP